MMPYLCLQFPSLSTAPIGITNYVSYHCLTTYHQDNMTHTKLHHLLCYSSHPMTLSLPGSPNTHLNTFPFSLSFSLLIIFLITRVCCFYLQIPTSDHLSQMVSNHLPKSHPTIFPSFIQSTEDRAFGEDADCYREIFPELSIPHVIKIVNKY